MRNTLTTQSNFDQQAARANSENAVVISGEDDVIQRFLANWTQVTALAEPYRPQ